MPSRTDGGPEISARPVARGARAAGVVVSIKAAATRGADPAVAGIGAAGAGTAAASVTAAPVAAAFRVWAAAANPGAAAASVGADRGAADSAGKEKLGHGDLDSIHGSFVASSALRRAEPPLGMAARSRHPVGHPGHGRSRDDVDADAGQRRLLRRPADRDRRGPASPDLQSRRLEEHFPTDSDRAPLPGGGDHGREPSAAGVPHAHVGAGLRADRRGRHADCRGGAASRHERVGRWRGRWDHHPAAGAADPGQVALGCAVGDRALSRDRAHRQWLHADSRRAGGTPSAPARAGIGFAFDKELHLGYRAGMAKAKRWALSVPIDGFALPEHADLAREAERLGYTDAWSYEADGLDCFASLAPLALAPGMRLGTALPHGFPRGPATLAMSAATVADLAPGRFILGIGAGSQPIVESWNGGHFALPATRVREMVQVVRAVLAGERVVFRGKALTVDGFRLVRPPTTPVPIYVAALRAGMLRVAGGGGAGRDPD